MPLGVTNDLTGAAGGRRMLRAHPLQAAAPVPDRRA